MLLQFLCYRSCSSSHRPLARSSTRNVSRSNVQKLVTVLLIMVFILALQSCTPTLVQPTASHVVPTLDTATPLSPTNPTLFVETPECTQSTVPPTIVDVQPSPALPGSKITITGTGGYIQDSCGGINESARSFKLYLDDEPVGDLLCYVNRCETTITLTVSIPSDSHCLATQTDVCEFEFKVGPE
jgi:hypothetical protein